LTEPITVERDGHVLLIGVNRPAKRFERREAHFTGH
jgi:hypothetical protein